MVYYVMYYFSYETMIILFFKGCHYHLCTHTKKKIVNNLKILVQAADSPNGLAAADLYKLSRKFSSPGDWSIYISPARSFLKLLMALHGVQRPTIRDCRSRPAASPISCPRGQTASIDWCRPDVTVLTQRHTDGSVIHRLTTD